MSLHAQLSPEAQAKLAAQKRNSTISAIIISLLVCALMGVILWIIALSPMFKNNEETVSYSASSDSDSEVTKPEMTNQVETKPSSPSSSMAKVIASTTPSPTAVLNPFQCILLSSTRPIYLTLAGLSLTMTHTLNSINQKLPTKLDPNKFVNNISQTNPDPDVD